MLKNIFPKKKVNLRIFSFLLATLFYFLGIFSKYDFDFVQQAQAQNTAAVVLMYHRFGESKFPSTNVTLAQFEAHLNELRSNSYNVISLPEIIAALKADRKLPDRTIGISIDDAYISIYTKAWPRLRATGFPFTVFVATKPVDQKNKNYMSWSQIRELHEAGVTIGSQTANHPHLTYMKRHDIEKELSSSNARFLDELGALPVLFAYPYGEANRLIEKVVKDFGFSAAFGQHSGVISGAGNTFYLPRFTLNETYGSIKRFKLIANALPLHISDLMPYDHVIKRENPPLIGFTVIGEKIPYLKRLNCFASHEGKAKTEKIGEQRFEVRVKKPFPKGRTRLNCTLPADAGRWHWLGRQFFVP